LEAVCDGVNLLPEEPPPIGTRFCRVVVVDLLALEEDELPLDDDLVDVWLPYPGDTLIGCCTTGAGA
jgi:hypothetical protein